MSERLLRERVKRVDKDGVRKIAFCAAQAYPRLTQPALRPVLRDSG